jgi:hypothetical protein
MKYLELGHTVAKGARAVPLAGAIKLEERVKGNKVV